MNADHSNASGWLIGCLLAAVVAYFAGAAQVRQASLSEPVRPRILWPTPSELHR